MTIDRQQQRTETQQRAAILITLLTFALMVVIALVTIFLVPNESKTPIDNLMMPFVALSAGYAYYLSRSGNHVRGIYILLASIAVTAALYPLAANNVGIQTAVVMLLITTGIANSALPERAAGRISAAAFLLAIFIVVVELSITPATDIPVTTSAIVITAGLASIYLSLIVSRFRTYSLQTKFIVIFIAISLISGSAVAFAVVPLVLAQLTDRVEQQLTGVASQSAAAISAELNTQVNLLRTFSLNSLLAQALSASATSGDLDELLRRDSQWRAADAADNDSDPLVQSVLNHQISRELLKFRNEFPAHAEVFVTDVHGANIASTNRTSDYYQADEEWWQATYNDGSGAIYISQPVFDESAQLLAVQMAVPIFDPQSGVMLGILRTTLDLKVFVPAFENGRLGETGRTEIYLPGGYELEIELEEDGEYHLELEEAPRDFIVALQEGSAFMDTLHDGEAILSAQAPLPAISDSAEVTTALQNLEWRVVTLQNRGEALQTIADVTRAAQLVGIGTLLIAGLMAALLTRFLTRPITRLTQTAEEIASGNIEASARVESPDEIGVLAESFNRMTGQLRESLATLERRVAERTADLETARLLSERRAAQLLAVGEISKIINSEQKLDILLPLITQLVSERFGNYHTGIFLVDESKTFAVLRAANSEGGRNMLQRGHKLAIGESGIVGHVTKFGEPRIALDVGQDAAYFNNPDLPNTRSEMTFPLKFRDEIIGALDVQSKKPGAFTEEDASILSILADQIAIAIENARLFQQTQQSLEELQTLYGSRLQAGWLSFSQSQAMAGYHQTIGGGKALKKPVNTGEIQQAMNQGETLVISADGGFHEPAIVIPIKLRGQAIGAISIKAPTRERLWTAAEINFAEAISERLSLALENARLLQESRLRAAKEQTISEITGKIGASINLQNVLQTAVEELGRSLPGAEVFIQLQETNGDKGKEQA